MNSYIHEIVAPIHQDRTTNFFIYNLLTQEFTNFLLTKMVRLQSQLQKQTAFTCMFHTQLAPLNIQKTDCKQESSGDGEGMLVIQWTTHNKTGV